jgi:hypothetical protein
MEKIEGYLKTAEFHKPSTKTCETLPPRLTVMIFSRMQGKYGHKWASAYPSKDQIKLGMRAWELTLAGLDISDIERGFSQWKGDWPPSDEEFLKACQKEPVLAASKKYTALPKPEPDPEIAKEHIEQMKKRLGKNP